MPRAEAKARWVTRHSGPQRSSSGSDVLQPQAMPELGLAALARGSCFRGGRQHSSSPVFPRAEASCFHPVSQSGQSLARGSEHKVCGGWL